VDTKTSVESQGFQGVVYKKYINEVFLKTLPVLDLLQGIHTQNTYQRSEGLGEEIHSPSH